jgi:hypothetical protein
MKSGIWTMLFSIPVTVSTADESNLLGVIIYSVIGIGFALVNITKNPIKTINPGLVARGVFTGLMVSTLLVPGAMQYLDKDPYSLVGYGAAVIIMLFFDKIQPVAEKRIIEFFKKETSK